MVTQQIPIQAVANQAFTVIIDGNTWDFAIKSTNGVMSVSLTLNSVDLIDNTRAVAGMRIIPSQYEEAGNFVFYTQNFALPDYTQFNITQVLVYYSAVELAAIRTLPTPPLTAAYFNPIAALPLRFSPQGYTA
jgi:hypothetical protein